MSALNALWGWVVHNFPAAVACRSLHSPLWAAGLFLSIVEFFTCASIEIWRLYRGLSSQLKPRENRGNNVGEERINKQLGSGYVGLMFWVKGGVAIRFFFVIMLLNWRGLVLSDDLAGRAPEFYQECLSDLEMKIYRGSVFSFAAMAVLLFGR